VQLGLLYAGRFLTGMSAGGSTVVVPLYSSEIAEPAIRGIVGVYLDLSMTIGILLAYLVGALAGDATPVAIAALGLVLSVASAVAACAMPETPIHLVAKNRRADARLALLWLRTGDRSERSKGKLRPRRNETVQIRQTDRPPDHPTLPTCGRDIYHPLTLCPALFSR